MLKVVNGQIGIALENDEIVAVALMVAEEEVLAMGTGKVGPILATYLYRRCCGMFGISELYPKPLKAFV